MALFGGAGAIPVMLPPMGEAECEALDRLDGLLVPGSPSNVHPSLYKGGESATPDFHDAGARRDVPAADPRGASRGGCRCWRSAAASRS